MKVAFILLSSFLGVSGTADDAVFPPDCPNITVLRDVTGGWQDNCMGLDEAEPNVTTAEACMALCNSDMNCSVWQMTDKACFFGYPKKGCRTRAGGDNITVVGGQRIQHGFIESYNTTPPVFTKGLLEKPVASDTETPKEKVDRCRDICISDTTCTVWQFVDDKCMVEHIPGHAAGETINLTENQEWSDGGTITHHCNPPVIEEEECSIVIFPCPGDSTAIKALKIIGLIAVPLLIIGGIVAAMQGGDDKPTELGESDSEEEQ